MSRSTLLRLIVVASAVSGVADLSSASRAKSPRWTAAAGALWLVALVVAVFPGLTLRVLEGKLHLATCSDLATREVVGWALADHHRAELPIAALRLAAGPGQLEAGCIMHTDRGRSTRLPNSVP